MKAAIMQQEGTQLDDGYFVPAVHCQPKETNAARNAAASASAPTQLGGMMGDTMRKSGLEIFCFFVFLYFVLLLAERLRKTSHQDVSSPPPPLTNGTSAHAMKPSTGMGALEEDMEDYFLPYGTVGLVNNLVGLWMWACILAGRAPLWPGRRIKQHWIVAVFGFGWIIALAFLMFAQMPRMKSEELQLMTVGFFIAILVNQFLGITLAAPKQAEEKKANNGQGEAINDEQEQDETQAEGGAGGAGGDLRDDETRRSAESTRSSDSLTDNLLFDLEDETTEKTTFLHSFSSPLRLPGMPLTEGKQSDGGERSEGQGKLSNPIEWKFWPHYVLALLFFVLFMAAGHTVILVGVVNLAKEVMAKPNENDPIVSRQQREIRDVFVMSGVLQVLCTFVGIVISTLGSWVAKRMKAEEDTGEEEAAERVQEGARLVKLQFKAWSANLIVLGTLNISIWCQYFVLAAVVGDTHGTKGLFEFGNLRLLYIIMSKLLFLAH
ncbi:hypothetical protein CMUS01_08448 [Colletotrichum musicola]|uniref:Uncharacterized protein n=1 Tax=Colletotrichum musicola TaxID=2175873 RepID=A0A8H6NCZ0_9PEZI|nr:hypothetical protein CMUS01_08448 [Colletotrichum musicola]